MRQQTGGERERERRKGNTCDLEYFATGNLIMAHNKVEVDLADRMTAQLS